MIDRVAISKELERLKDELGRITDEVERLKDDCLKKGLTNDGLKILSLDVEKVLDRSVRTFINETGDLYSSQILDITEQNEFIDFKNGYKGQMYAWLKEHPILTKELKIDDIEKECSCEKQKTMQSAGLSALAVTVVYFISGSVILALAAAVLGLVITIFQKKKGCEEDIKRYENTLQNRMKELVDAIREEADGWLEDVEKKSDEVLKSFGLNFFD